jgi:hypothetical protein
MKKSGVMNQKIIIDSAPAHDLLASTCTPPMHADAPPAPSQRGCSKIYEKRTDIRDIALFWPFWLRLGYDSRTIFHSCAVVGRWLQRHMSESIRGTMDACNANGCAG